MYALGRATFFWTKIVLRDSENSSAAFSFVTYHLFLLATKKVFCKYLCTAWLTGLFTLVDIMSFLPVILYVVK